MHKWPSLKAPESPWTRKSSPESSQADVVAGVVVLHWTVVLTLAIGCIIVMLMKGPAYVADAYHLNDSDRPA